MRRGEDFLDAHAFDALPKVLAEDAVAVAEEIGGCGVVREGVDELLGGPGGGGMLGDALGDAEVDDPSTMVSEHDENEEHAQAGGGDGEEVEGDEVAGMIGKDGRHVWEGGVRRFGSNRETVRSATLIPSFCSSPWILGALHKGFDVIHRSHAGS
jgi:hypothetical protein